MKSDAILYIFSKLVVAGGQVLILPFAVVQLGADGYGVYTLILQAGLLLRLLIAEHITQTILRLYSDNAKKGTESDLVVCGWKYLAASACVVNCFAGIGIFYPQGIGLTNYQWILVIIYGLVMTMHSYQLTLLLARQEIKKTSIVEIANGLGVLIVPVVIGRTFPAPDAYAIGAIISITISNIFLLSISRAYLINSNSAHDPKLLMTIRNYGLPLTASYLLYWVIGVADRFQISATLTSYEVGVYTASYQLIVAPITLIFTSLATVWQPRLFSQEFEQATLAVRRSLSTITIIGILYILLATFFSQRIISLITGGKIEPDIYLVLLLAIAGISNGYASIAILWAKYRMHSGELFYSLFLAAALLLLGNAIYLPTYGLHAAAMTTLLAYCVIAVFLFARSYLTRVYYRRRPR